MLTEKDYCDYETCVALRELGFNALVDWYFNEDKRIVSSLARYRNTYIPRISLYEAQKWLREEKEFYVFVGREWENTYYYWISKKFGDKTEGITHSFYYPNGEGQFSSYEEALSEGIKEAVKILKEK